MAGIEILSSIDMGMVHHSDIKVKRLKSATAAILLIKHEDGSMVHGIGIMYPDLEHLYFSRTSTRDPRKLMQCLYAASKIKHPLNEAIGQAILVADETVPVEDTRFMKLGPKWLKYGYSVSRLRNEALALEFPNSEIKKISEALLCYDSPLRRLWTKVQLWWNSLFSQENLLSV